MRKALTLSIWAIAILSLAYNGFMLFEYYDSFRALDKGTSIAAYRTGLVVVSYALARSLTIAITEYFSSNA